MKFNLIPAVFAALIFLILINTASASLVFEKSFSEMGQDAFSVNAGESEKCTEMLFSVPGDSLVDRGNVPILALKAEFLPSRSGKATISVSLNGTLLDSLKPEDFTCDESGCWKYIYPNELNYPVEIGVVAPGEITVGPWPLLKASNALKICANIEDKIESVTIHNESLFGIYKTAYFPTSESIFGFTKTIDRETAMLGDEVNITISLTNTGSADAEVQIRHIKPLVEDNVEITSFNVLKGDSDWDGVMKAGETKTITYTIKPIIAAHFTLPAASATYTNEFGKTETVISNYPEITVSAPETKINAYIFRETELRKVGERTNMRAIIKNNGTFTVADVKLLLEAPQQISIIGEQEVAIGALRPNEVIYYDYEIVSQQEGEFEMGCKVVAGEETFNCENAIVSFEAPKTDWILIAGIVLAIIAVIIYGYIFFEWKPKKEAATVQPGGKWRAEK